MVLNRLRSLSPIDAVAGVVALAALAGEDPDSIKQQLSGVDRFLDGLRN